MDMLMVDLGPAVDDRGANVAVGDTAVLWGPSNNDEEPMVRLSDLVAALNTTQSSLTCGLDKLRVRRSFL
jgi:alanine racemase